MKKTATRREFLTCRRSVLADWPVRRRLLKICWGRVRGQAIYVEITNVA